MAKTLLYVSVLLTFLTAVGGFLTKQKIDLVNQDLKDRRSEVVTLKGNATKLMADAKKASEETVAANKVVEEQKGKLEAAVSEVATAKGDAEKAKAAQTEADGKLASVTTERDDALKKIAEFPVGISPEKFAAMQAESEKAKTELAEARQVQDTLKSRAHEFEEKNASLAKEVQRYHTLVAKPGVMGRVVAVNSGWNFVVIDVGDKRGAVINAPLIVTRGGATVARLKITSVEPSSSIADVVPGSVVRGQSVQPGDSVIFGGRQNFSAPPDEAAPAPAGNAALGAAAPPALQ